MPNATANISLRLPEQTRRALDGAARLTRRSRAFIIKEALELYLATIVLEHQTSNQNNALAGLLALEGAGVRGTGRSLQDIDAQVSRFRGDEKTA